MSNINANIWNTTPLTLSVMTRVGLFLELDIHDNTVADALYWICCDLEDWPEDEGFGTSDTYSFVEKARKEFGLELE